MAAGAAAGAAIGGRLANRVPVEMLRRAIVSIGIIVALISRGAPRRGGGHPFSTKSVSCIQDASPPVFLLDPSTASHCIVLLVMAVADSTN